MFMKYKAFFILLIVISNLFAAEQPKANESSISQEDKSKSNTDSLNAEKENNSLISELKESTTEDLPNIINKEVPSISELKESSAQNSTNEEVPSSNESTQTTIQSEEETNIKDTELSTNQLLEEKKEEQPENLNKITPINKEDEESKKWTKLNREIKKHKSKSIYKRQYDSLNEHLPTTIFTDDYSKQFFYCIKKGNLNCLRGVINKLEKIGLTIQEILRFRNKLGDTPLIYAVKQDQIDIVRFLLLQGANPEVVDDNLKSPIDIAIERKQINIINAIAEMIPYLLEDKEINNEENSAMYNWAIKTKENTCNAKDN